MVTERIITKTFGLLLFESRAPIWAPKTQPAPMQTAGSKTICPNIPWLIVPTSELTIKIKVDEATAIWAGKPRIKTIIGTSMIPPPIPKIVEMNPTQKVKAIPNGRLNLAVAGSKPSAEAVARLELDFQYMKQPNTAKSVPKATEKPAPVKYWETRLPVNAPGIVAIANGIAALNMIRLWRR